MQVTAGNYKKIKKTDGYSPKGFVKFHGKIYS